MITPAAIQHSRQRLEKARSALALLKEARNFAEAESAWSDILIAGSGVYTKIEQGSKAKGQATAWFGRMKNARKSDPLLSYMLHARNSDEHSIEDITHRVGAGTASLTIVDTPAQPFDPMKLVGMKLHVDLDKQSGHVKVRSSNESRIATAMYDKDTLELVTVTDRSVRYDPPLSHKDIAINGRSPFVVGEAYVAYLAGLIDEALTFGI